MEDLIGTGIEESFKRLGTKQRYILLKYDLKYSDLTHTTEHQLQRFYVRCMIPS